MPQSDLYSRWCARAKAWLGAISTVAFPPLPPLSLSLLRVAGNVHGPSARRLTHARYALSATPLSARRPTRLAAATLFAVLPFAAAHADPIVDHDAMVQQLIDQQHASPLVADCAAHAAFVVPTSRLYDHVEFLPAELDDQHASTEAWNQPFDDRKQRINVETIVQVSGLGYRKNASDASQPDLLHFRCGYVQDKLLAFGYNEPPQAPAIAEAPPRPRGGHGRTTTTRHAAHGKAVAHGTSRHGKASTPSRATGKSNVRTSTKSSAGAKSSKSSKSPKSTKQTKQTNGKTHAKH